MPDLSNFAVASDSRQITVIDMSNDVQDGLLMIFLNSLGRLVLIRGLSDRDNNTNWSWQDETDKLNSLLAPRINIALGCDKCGAGEYILDSGWQYHLFCYPSSEYSSNDRSYNESIVEFSVISANSNSPHAFPVEFRE